VTRRRILFTLAGLAFSAGIAFLLRDAILETVIVPLAYLWWVIGLYYRLVPQALVWIALIFIVLLSSARAILISIPVKRKTMQKRGTAVGPIEHLSVLVEKRGRGIYYKWLIANRLGKVARELLEQREQHATKRFTRLTGRNWRPPAGVEAYLESGLNGSFADYPQPRWLYPQPTPLDQDPRPVVEYLEDEMEIGRHGNR
jgi:hypothetical protein